MQSLPGDTQSTSRTHFLARDVHSKDFYYELRAEKLSCRVSRAARTIFLNKTGFNGLYRQNKMGQFNVPFGHYKSCPAVYSSDNILLVSERLANTTLMNEDFSILLSQAGEGDFVYCDPPYEPITPTSNFNSYTGVGFSRADQIRLKNECRAAVDRGAVVAVSNSSAQFIKDLYSESTLQTIRARRAINSNPSGRGAIDELLILMHRDR
ncbi:Dam family site-specific DNA-(adenine-N6)-methyltransferase [bacterium]|nr:Dam family site-specific DNA-(adenine-N6)-methyltransferase [bacterium]